MDLLSITALVISDDIGLLLIFLMAQIIIGVIVPREGLQLPYLWRFVEDRTIKLESRLNRSKRTQKARFIRGIVLLVFMLICAILIGEFISFAIVNFRFGWGLVLLFIYMTMSAVFPLKILIQGYKFLKKGEVKKLCDLLQPLTKLDLSSQDEHGQIRELISLSSWGLNRMAIGPIFWFFLLGPVGLSIYVTVSAMDKVIGHDTKRYHFFGGATAILDDALNFLPARLTGIIISFSSLFAPATQPFQSFQVLFKQANTIGSMNTGWPLSAMAGGIGISLAGPMKTLSGQLIKRPWLGLKGSTAQVTTFHVQKALILCVVSTVMLGVLCVMTISFKIFIS